MDFFFCQAREGFLNEPAISRDDVLAPQSVRDAIENSFADGSGGFDEPNFSENVNSIKDRPHDRIWWDLEFPLANSHGSL